MSFDPLFLDSAYVIALAQATDQHHEKAATVAVQIAEQNTQLITTRAVLLEIGSALARTKNRSRAVRLIDSLHASPLVQVVAVTEERAKQGWELFRQRPDKAWSWTDCISFIVMSERGLTQALTADQHFEQAGFTALLCH